MDKTGQNVHIFEEVLFSSYIKTESEKKTKKKPTSALSLCELDAGRLAEGKGEEELEEEQ